MPAAFIVPRTVQAGSVLAVVAPAGPFDRDAFDAGVEWLRTRYEVRFDGGIYSRCGFLAGDDARRLGELRAALADPVIDAILCARGGYGATRLLGGLDPATVATANKLLVGFSDATALHALWARAGVRSLHATMVAGLGTADAAVRDRWVAAVENHGAPRRWELETLVGGRAEGRLIGGNLAVLGALLGTPFAPPVDGCLLFLEDVGERPYRVDRLLTQMRSAGWFERASGIVLGSFTESSPGPDGVSLDDVLCERLGGTGLPVLRGFAAGHIDDHVPVPFGALARLDGGALEIVG
ncbi:LD-carboxypeptidase [soil metagenome]